MSYECWTEKKKKWMEIVKCLLVYIYLRTYFNFNRTVIQKVKKQIVGKSFQVKI